MGYQGGGGAMGGGGMQDPVYQGYGPYGGPNFQGSAQGFPGQEQYGRPPMMAQDGYVPPHQGRTIYGPEQYQKRCVRSDSESGGETVKGEEMEQQETLEDFEDSRVALPIKKTGSL